MSTPLPEIRSLESIVSLTIKFAKAGGPEVLEFIETQVPDPGPLEVRIKVKAIGPAPSNRRQRHRLMP